MLEQAFNEGKVSACEVFEMIEDNADDINLIGYHSSRGVEDMYIDEFDKKHGEDGSLCVPVSSNSDYEKVEKLDKITLQKASDWMPSRIIKT